MATCTAPVFGSTCVFGVPKIGVDLTCTILPVLALLCGLVLSRLTIEALPVATPAIASSGSKTEQVRAFYDGMNRYLATGDERFLQLLAPGFQEWDALDAGAGSSATLLARLDDMRQHAAHPQFTIADMTDLGNLVEVQLAVEQPATLDVAGLTATIDAPPTTTELVQFERNAIVAHWSHGGLVPLIDHAIDTPVPLEAGDAVLFGVYRVTLDPGAWLKLPGDAPFGVMMEHGSATIYSGTVSQRLAAGDDRWIEPAGRTRIVNPEAGQIVFWFVAMGTIRADYAGIDGVFEWPKQPDVTMEQLVKYAPYSWRTNPTGLRLRVARVTLPPGTQLTASQPGMGEGLGLLDGVLEVTVSQGVARHLGPDKQNDPIADRASVVAKASSRFMTRSPPTASPVPPPPRCWSSPPFRSPPERGRMPGMSGCPATSPALTFRNAWQIFSVLCCRSQ